MQLITDESELSKVVQSAKSSRFAGCDTEFCRKTSYFPRISLMQISTLEEDFVIDCLAIEDLKNLQSLFRDGAILKIFHSSSQDLEIIYRIFDEMPRNIFDTQIAACVCKLGSHVSYSDLCLKFLGEKIDKTHQNANWMKRPLKQSMIEYAAQDAGLLHGLYQNLDKKLSEKSLHDEFNAEMQKLEARVNKRFSKTYDKPIKCRSSSQIIRQRIKKIADFRESMAMELNIPRNFLLKDSEIISVAKKMPIINDGLKKMGVIYEKSRRSRYFHSELEKFCDKILQSEKLNSAEH